MVLRELWLWFNFIPSEIRVAEVIPPAIDLPEEDRIELMQEIASSMGLELIDLEVEQKRIEMERDPKPGSFHSINLRPNYRNCGIAVTTGASHRKVPRKGRTLPEVFFEVASQQSFLAIESDGQERINSYQPKICRIVATASLFKISK